MKRWSWILAIVLSFSTLAIVGCSGDDEDTTPTTTTTVVTNIVGGVHHTNVVVVTNAPAPTPPPAVTSRVLLDTTGAITGTHKARFDTAAAPAHGTVAFSASWTSTFPDGSPHPANLFLWFDVNGNVFNSGSDSPWDGGVEASAGSPLFIMIGNDNAGTIANVHVRAVWTAN